MRSVALRRRFRSGRPVRLIKALDDIPAAVAAIARANDLVITLGAGSIGTLPDRILDALGGPDAPAAKATAEKTHGG